MPARMDLRPRAVSTLGASAFLIAAAIAVFAWVAREGARLAPDVSGFAVPRTGGAEGIPVAAVLRALLVVTLASQALAAICKRLRQPPVIGEVIAGILLGPSLFGRFAAGAFESVFSPRALPYLGLLAQIGVVLFMFLVGMELDTGLLRKRGGAAVVISVASMTVAFTMGSVLALWLYVPLAPSGVPFLLFALFIGVSMSVTAFPVLVRILTDRGIQKTELGILAISCAAVDDVAAWCLLAFVSSLGLAQVDGAFRTLAAATAYVAFVLVVVRPAMRAAISRHEQSGRSNTGLLGLLVTLMLASAFATEWIGIHAVFGAFLIGALVPHDSEIARDLAARLQGFVGVLFLPAFFAFTGLRTQLNLLDDARLWTTCLVILAVACAGKLGGTFAAARYAGLGTREAATLGALMNTRGLMELIVLNVGLEQGVISPTLFSMLVVMAVVTTLLTAPLLDLLARPARPTAADRA